MALETRNNSGNTIYLQLDFQRGSLFIYSKEEQDGFEKHTSSKGNISYRKYVNAVSGVIQSAYIRDARVGGKEFVLVISDGEERYSIAINQDSSAYISLSRLLPNIDVNKFIRFSAYNSEYNGKTYINVSISYPNEINEEGKPTLVKWSELPAPKQMRSGKWDFSEQEDEALVRGTEFIEKNDFKSKNNQVSTPAPEVDVDSEQKDEDEDLPF